MQKRSSTNRSLTSLIAVLGLGAGVSCAARPAPDFTVLRRPPVMSEATEEAAAHMTAIAAEHGKLDPLAEFAWSCDAYGAYIEALRGAP